MRRVTLVVAMFQSNAQNRTVRSPLESQVEAVHPLRLSACSSRPNVDRRERPFRRARVVCIGLLALAAFGALTAASPSRAEDKAAPVEEAPVERFRKLLDACDALGWTTGDALGGPVAVHEVGSEEGHSVDYWGFVLAEDGEQVTLLNHVGATAVVHSTASPTERGQASIAPITLDDAAARTLALSRGFSPWDSAWGADDTTRRVVSAAHLRRAGRPELASRVLAPADADVDPLDVGESRELVAERALWRIVFDFSRPKIPRTELLARLRAWTALFGGTEHEAMAAELLVQTERLVREDEERAARPRAAVEPTPTEQAKELIWLLRDCHMGGRAKSPARDVRDIENELAALRWTAVPRLIDALGDTRPTRVVVSWREYAFRGHKLLRVGDLARSTLSSMGIAFKAERWSTRCGDPGWESVESSARAWWKEWEPRGEAAFLLHQIETVRHWQGDRAFEWLVQVDPIEALRIASDATNPRFSDAERCEAVRRLAAVASTAADEALIDTFESDASLYVRVHAALAMNERKLPAAAAAMSSALAEAVEIAALDHQPSLVALARELTRLGGVHQDAVAELGRRDASRWRPILLEAWEPLIVQVPRATFAGEAHALASDYALEALERPHLPGLYDEHTPHPWAHSTWTRFTAAAALAHLRGTEPIAFDATPLRRLLEEHALVAAECADRGRARPDGPVLVTRASEDVAGAPNTLRDLSLATGQSTYPGTAALAPVSVLVGVPIDAANVTAALLGTFGARPGNACGVTLRLWRTDGPVHAEVLFEAGDGSSSTRFERGDGKKIRDRALVSQQGSACDRDDSIDAVRGSVAVGLRALSKRDRIVDLRVFAR